jgi:hypothetical protein
MLTPYVVVTVLAAGANIYAAANDFLRPEWLVANMTRLRVPQSWIFALGALKAAGALGLLVGIGLPLIGIAAAAGLVMFFVGAIVTACVPTGIRIFPTPRLFSGWPRRRWCCDWPRSDRRRATNRRRGRRRWALCSTVFA